MQPIINPALFYLIDLSKGLSFFFGIIGGFTLTVVFIVGLLVMCEDGYDTEDKDVMETWKRIKYFLIVGLACIFMTVIIPSEETCYKMVAANIVTPKNIEAVSGTATDIIDYIVDSVEEIIDGKED